MADTKNVQLVPVKSSGNTMSSGDDTLIEAMALSTGLGMSITQLARLVRENGQNSCDAKANCVSVCRRIA